MLPIMTVLSVQFARLLGGAVVIEVVFAWPGMGRLLVNAVENLDYPVIQAVLLILVFVFILINVLTDVLYGIADPRIRLGN
jgi:ABC-type dipeptide/oligopeptide/nickel transport system permease component